MVEFALPTLTCATHCSHPQPNSVVYGEAYGQGMSSQWEEMGRVGAEALPLSVLRPADWHSLAVYHMCPIMWKHDVIHKTWNTWHIASCQRKTEPWPEEIDVVFEICKWMDNLTDMLITVLCTPVGQIKIFSVNWKRNVLLSYSIFIKTN